MDQTSSPWNRPWLRLAAVVIWMAGIFAMSHRERVPRAPGLSGEVTSILGHLSVYFGLAILIWWALGLVMEPSGRRSILAWVLTVAYGLTDEWHQSFVPGRTPDAFDIATDAVGAALGLLLVNWLLRRMHGGIGPERPPSPSSSAAAR